MILRSVTKHVNDQNWFAVISDLVIVVFGNTGLRINTNTGQNTNT